MMGRDFPTFVDGLVGSEAVRKRGAWKAHAVPALHKALVQRLTSLGYGLSAER